MRFFKGDVAWGPRYLTPVFAVLWLFVPTTAAFAGKLRTGLVLGLGMVVQLLSLATDPHRAYIIADIPPHVLLYEDAAFYDLRLSHLFMRPGEVWDVLSIADTTEAASPAPTPTFALPLPDLKLIEPSVARRYVVLPARAVVVLAKTFGPCGAARGHWTYGRPAHRHRTRRSALVGSGLRPDRDERKMPLLNKLVVSNGDAVGLTQ